ncbi:oxidoreductase [Fusarium beomiforme]|uniref:Oxidoreductase n=1 Tax=Fusarium beomiforme TaxID=44412 RepID=A0A9P5DRF5_9HYPO|nr:oxidoreductase [Fusarium beomiforme]
MAESESFKKINLVRIAHVFYQHADAAKQTRFLQDFGLEITKHVGPKTYFRGTGPEPFLYCLISSDKNEFGGVAFVVESRDDLELAAKTLPGATGIREMTDEPGGGVCVTFKDPTDGFPFHLVYGQTLVDPTEEAKLPKTNFVRIHFSVPFCTCTCPSPVHKLGHVGMCVTNFANAYDFYTSRFNFVPSDLVHDETGRDISAFLHLDRGSELVDHHCFFFFQGPKSHVHHSSFETRDFDTQLLGHDWLRQRGYENCWGVGRHIMGSQIFDYWFDPSRFILEHYVDGDLVDSSHPTQRSKASPDSLHVWGPDLPESFLE